MTFHDPNIGREVVVLSAILGTPESTTGQSIFIYLMQTLVEICKSLGVLQTFTVFSDANNLLKSSLSVGF